MWLLRLYPRAWRERYGEEMTELLSRARWSPSLVIDLVAGAIDARMNPQIKAERPDAAEDPIMIARMKCRCAGHSDITATQKALSASVMLGSALVLTAIWMWVAVTYHDSETRQYILAFIQLPLFAGYILTMPFTMLRGRSVSSTVVVMSVSFIVLISWCALIGFAASALG